MKFANLVAVSSIQRTQTGGLLSLLSFFPCRGPYISFWSLVRPGLQLTDFYCLILSRLLANIVLVFLGFLFVFFVCLFCLGVASDNSAVNLRFTSFTDFQLLTDNVQYSLGNAGEKKSRLLANMQLRFDILSSSHNYFCGNTKIYCFLRADWFFLGLELQQCESQRADTFCITMVDYKIHFQKYQLWRPPKRGSFFM